VPEVEGLLIHLVELLVEVLLVDAVVGLRHLDGLQPVLLEGLRVSYYLVFL
jgi:hypothetical protein